MTAVVHWDGKMLPELTGREKVERIPIIISYSDGEQLLGVPKVVASTGVEISRATFNMLTEWGISDKIVAACFDTTASNSGRFNGSAVLLEQLLERSLLYLPCRHHICELYLRAAFESSAGSSSVSVPLFERFQIAWAKIDQKLFKFGILNDYVATRINKEKNQIIDFCRCQLKKDHARSDYRELLELTILFLGIVPEGHNFRPPGPMHHARWMSKAIYTLKLYLFREVFRLTKHEEKYLRDVSVFIVKFYVQLWFRSPLAVEAPNRDFQFIRAMYNYSEVDERISLAVLKKTCNHLWYLADENITLALFDDNVTVAEKREMAQRLLAFADDTDKDEHSVKRINLKVRDLSTFVSKKLSDFITSNSIKFFDRLNVSKSFLVIDPSKWHDHEDFKNAVEIVRKLKVVNDIAERGVKLMQDYNKKLTTKELEYQKLLQVVKEYTKKYPFSSKKSLKN